MAFRQKADIGAETQQASLGSLRTAVQKCYADREPRFEPGLIAGASSNLYAQASESS